MMPVLDLILIVKYEQWICAGITSSAYLVLFNRNRRICNGCMDY